MSISTYGIGVDTDVIGGASAYGFGVKILIPFFTKAKEFLVRMTRIREEEVQK